MYKAALIDVDGVLKLYTPQGLPESFEPEAIKGIRMLEDSEMKICYVSGKKASYVDSCRTSSGLNGNSFIAGENGGIIYGPNFFVRYEKHVKDLGSLRKNISVVQDKWDYFRKNGLKGWVMEEDKDTSLTILLSGMNSLEFTNYLEGMIDSMGLELDVIHGPSYVDVLQRGADKAYALRIFSEITGIRPEEIVGIGDGKNDIPMLRYVGLPAAPSNATPEVKGIVQERGGYLASKSIGTGFLEICQYVTKL